MNEKKNILAIVGTNSSKSTNRQLLEYIKRNYSETFNIHLREINNIPIFNLDRLNGGDIPGEVIDLIDIINFADGVIISTPEYNQSITAALKSVLEWLSVNIKESLPLKEKKVMIVGASSGFLGTVRGQVQLKQILRSPGLEANILEGNDFFLGNSNKKFDILGNLKEENDRLFLDKCLNNFKKFLEEGAK